MLHSTLSWRLYLNQRWLFINDTFKNLFKWATKWKATILTTEPFCPGLSGLINQCIVTLYGWTSTRLCQHWSYSNVGLSHGYNCELTWLTCSIYIARQGAIGLKRCGSYCPIKIFLKSVFRILGDLYNFFVGFGITSSEKGKLLLIFWNLHGCKYIDGLVQDYSNSSALAMELPQSCTKSSILWFWHFFCWFMKDTIQPIYPLLCAHLHVMSVQTLHQRNTSVQHLPEEHLW